MDKKVGLWIKVNAEITDEISCLGSHRILDIRRICFELFSFAFEDKNIYSFWFSGTQDSPNSNIKAEKILENVSVDELMKIENFPGSSLNRPLYLRYKKLKRRAPVCWEQVPSKKSGYIIPELHYIKRTEAFETLKNAHEMNFDRTDKKKGNSWLFPLADNIPGFGKTAFAMNYIDAMKEACPEQNRNSFQKSICDSHTLCVEFSMEKYDEENPEEFVTSALKKELKQTLQGFENSSLANCCDSITLLTELIEEMGPLFVVLDEIGIPFQNKSPEKGQRMFWDFIEHTLSRWCRVRHLYFVIIGRSKFLQIVPLINYNSENSSCFIERLPLYPLTAEDIKKILIMSKYSENDNRSIMEFFNIKSDQLEIISQHLFLASCGNPRSLSRILRKTKNCISILTFQEHLRHLELSSILSHVKLYQAEVYDFLMKEKQGIPIDLTKEVENCKNRSKMEYHQVASNAGFIWHGNLEEATLQISEPLRNFIEYDGISLNEFLENFNNAQILTDDALCLEWIFFKRMLDLFSESFTPSLVLPFFFGSNVFGNLKGLYLLQKVKFFPKITARAFCKSDSNSKTATIEAAGAIIDEAFKESYASLFPRSKSCSPDAIFLTKAKDGNFQKKVLIAVSVKNFSTTKLGEQTINEEIEKVQNIISRMTEDEDLVVVLIVCATNFCDNIMQEFQNCGFFEYQQQDNQKRKIDEVLILNLSNQKFRAEFFGYRTGTMYSDAIEKMILKTNRENIIQKLSSVT